VGGISVFVKFALIGWFYFALLWFTYKLVTATKFKQVYLVYMSFYLGSFDVIARMAKTSPFIPYELSKYLLLPLLTYGLFLASKSWNRGYLMLLTIIPAFFYDFSGKTELSDLINYGIGPLILALSVAFFTDKKMNMDILLTCLRMFLYTSLMALAFAFIKTPEYDKIEFTLAANFQTSGGFGSNQVANVLGLGAIVMFIHFFYNKSLTGYRSLDLTILGLFMLQALLTMSRGGVFTAILAAIAFVFFLPKISSENSVVKINKGRVFTYLIIFSIVASGVFFYVDYISGNVLSMRYKGETIGTQAGVKDKSLTTFTSNRFDLVISELDMWYDYPITGVGIGASKHLRPEYTNVITSSHTEFSRLLADHGLPGLIFLIVWLSIYFYVNKKNKGVDRALLLTLFIVAFFTSTHSAMRVFITPLLTGLSVCIITSTNKTRLSKPLVLNTSDEAYLHRQ
jgi:hypothetical protein